MKKGEYLSINTLQTKKMGESLAKEILKISSNKKAFVIGLVGELGGGKTTFLQGFARGLRIKEKILSPTFVLMRKFQIPSAKFQFKVFYHIDCYRIKKSKEILKLGFKKLVSDPQNIIAIEWADRIKKDISQKNIWIKFNFIDKKTRKIVIEYKNLSSCPHCYTCLQRYAKHCGQAPAKNAVSTADWQSAAGGRQNLGQDKIKDLRLEI